MSDHESMIDDCFFGSVTVGERGQIVIPAAARRQMNISTGSKLLVVAHPSKHALMLLGVEAYREFLNFSLKKLESLEDEDAA